MFSRLSMHMSNLIATSTLSAVHAPLTSQIVLAIGRSPRWFGFSSRPSQLFLFPLVAIYL